jgi:hypothetical protein
MRCDVREIVSEIESKSFACLMISFNINGDNIKLVSSCDVYVYMRVYVFVHV